MGRRLSLFMIFPLFFIMPRIIGIGFIDHKYVVRIEIVTPIEYEKELDQLGCDLILQSLELW